MNKKNKVPTFDELIIPTFNALKKLGGSGSNKEIYEEVIESENYSEEILSIMQKNTNQTQVDYRLAWARTYLKKLGIINNTSRGIWVLNSLYDDDIKFNVKEMIKVVRDMHKNKIIVNKINTEDEIDISDARENWRSDLIKILQSIPPYAFEKLSMLLLRESGFSQVEVTKRTKDGGIDGYGKFKINGMISFNLAFQCKRYKGTVSSTEIRNFRGSMSSNIEKGVFITTGKFSRDAIKEAEADGKKHIDLIDGEELVDILAELKLGVKKETIYTIDTDFFDKFKTST